MRVWNKESLTCMSKDLFAICFFPPSLTLHHWVNLTVLSFFFCGSVRGLSDRPQMPMYVLFCLCTCTCVRAWAEDFSVDLLVQLYVYNLRKKRMYVYVYLIVIYLFIPWIYLLNHLFIYMSKSLSWMLVIH